MFFCSEVQRVADQMIEDNAEIKQSIRAVQEQFAEAKFEAEKQADEIVTSFCEGQRKHFQHLISFRKAKCRNGKNTDFIKDLRQEYQWRIAQNGKAVAVYRGIPCLSIKLRQLNQLHFV